MSEIQQKTSEHVSTVGNPNIAEAGKLTRWQPGVSPNPGGRPKRKRVTEAYKRIGKLSPEQYVQFKPRTMFEHLALKMFQSQGADFIPAVKEITNRTEGAVDSSEGAPQASTQNVLIVNNWKPKELDG